MALMSKEIHQDEVTAGQAAELLGWSETTFLKYRKRYNLRSIRRPGQGARKFFKRDDVLRLKDIELDDEDKNDGKKDD